MTAVLWAATAIFAGCFLIRLLFVGWNRLTPGLLVACAAAGVLVGFCEEVLFRGIVLRALRNGTRPEAWAVLASAVCFGLFHLTNIINGSPLEAVLPQVAIAAVSGAVLYLFRRGTGMLLAGMVAHGLWDFSLFVPGAGTTTAAVISVSFTVLVVIVGVVVLIAIIVRDRGTVTTPAGVRTGLRPPYPEGRDGTVQAMTGTSRPSASIPRAWLANDRPVFSATGSASMSARSRTTGPSPRRRTPVTPVLPTALRHAKPRPPEPVGSDTGRPVLGEGLSSGIGGGRDRPPGGAVEADLRP